MVRMYTKNPQEILYKYVVPVSTLRKLKQRNRDFGDEHGASLKPTFIRMGLFSMYRLTILLAAPLQMLSLPDTAFQGENNSAGTYFDLLDAIGPLMTFLILASRFVSLLPNSLFPDCFLRRAQDVRERWNLLLPSERAALRKKVLMEALENGGEPPAMYLY
ncbi:hypothetical protein SISSUDRAFT_289375 [Sistotremastrum suecicum HHB10207 ss-3]|uniref:Uncharacterized protein n=1 Tax=Sistotremastrum suecicum HHB10207 ss-3 TaxID=1314776 RepID=A0A165ZKC3_9AGAM|nr:hypothetical protein SISSUDRAFT_289375 [Sistotremastrum suecicum HHB10207 ss-3]